MTDKVNLLIKAGGANESADKYSKISGSGRIDIVVKYFYPVAAGIETNILETYKVLVEKEWEVTVHTSNVDYTTGEILPQREIIKGMAVKRYPLKKPCFMPEVPYDSTGLICLHNFNILPHFFILLKSLLLKLTGKKCFKLVLTPHGGFNPEWRVFSPMSAIVKYLYHYTLGVLLINLTVDAVRAVSDWEKDEMVKKGIKKELVSVISNGIEDDAFEDIENKAGKEVKERVNSFGRYILQIGRIYPIKNYETVLRALPDTPDSLNYVVAGPVSDQKYLKELKALAKSLGVENRVIFYGVIRGIDKYYLIKHAKAMVHMAIWESFCNVVHEAMSQGLPVVAANNTALRFLVKDKINGFLVETKDSCATTDKINFILGEENRDTIRQISENNLMFAKDSTWGKTAQKMHELYSSLMGGNL